MFSSCLHCHSRFATNTELPDLPLGKRIAYDPKRYHLWVVCRRCGGWNLTPFDRRVETVDRCEEIWRESRRIDTTQGIALTRTARGLELIRIGTESRAEFASWRYGKRFMHRQWVRGIQLGVGFGVAGLAVGQTWSVLLSEA
jgi:hypothetical protein